MAPSTTTDSTPSTSPSASTSISKATVLNWVSAIATRDFKALAALFTPTATWTVVANPTKASWGGTLPAQAMCQRVADVLSPFESWSYIAHDVVVDVDGELVVAECVSKGRGPGALKYDNNYLIKVRVDAKGKIMELKEMLDPYEVEIMFESAKKVAGESE